MQLGQDEVGATSPRECLQGLVSLSVCESLPWESLCFFPALVCFLPRMAVPLKAESQSEHSLSLLRAHRPLKHEPQSLLQADDPQPIQSCLKWESSSSEEAEKSSG